MSPKHKVEQLYEGFAKDINGIDYLFGDCKPSNHLVIHRCVDRALSHLSRVSNQTKEQYAYWDDCISYSLTL